MEDKPNYYAILPANVRYDNSLKANEKLLYAEITALTHKEGECWASNNYFANLYESSPQAVSKWLKGLESKGYITISYEYQGKEIVKRIIKEVSTNIDTYQQTIDRGINKCFKGYQQMIKENNTSINNTSINNYIVPDGIKEEFEAYKQMRKMMKKPMTDYAVRMALKKLNKMSSDINVQKEILNQSVEHSWLGLFPVKEFKQEDKLPVYDTSNNREYSEEYIEELLKLRDK